MATAIQIGDLMYHGQCTTGVEGERVAVEVDTDTEECCVACEAPLGDDPGVIDDDQETADTDEIARAEAHDQVQPGEPQA